MAEIEIGKIKKRKINVNILKKIGTNKYGITYKHIFILVLLITTITLIYTQISPRISGIFNNYLISANPAKNGKQIEISKQEMGNDSSNRVSNIPPTISNQTVTIQNEDVRAYMLDQYFLANHSPLYGTGKIFIAKCDQYKAPSDCLTIVAIAKHETDLCKYSNSADMHNCWGFGGGGIYRQNFTSFDDSIDAVTRSLVYSYGNKYITDPSLMERTFCGAEASCSGWGNRIKYFIDQIDQFSQNIGLGSMLAQRKVY